MGELFYYLLLFCTILCILLGAGTLTDYNFESLLYIYSLLSHLMVPPQQNA